MQAVLKIPSLLNENLASILKLTEDVECATPYILSSDPVSSSESFSIFADGEIVCRTTSLMKASRLLMATFYIFNYVYPKSSVSTLTFYQKIFLDLQDDAKKNTKVINLFTKILGEGM